MITNDSYFVGDLFIPNVGDNSSAIVSDDSNLQHFIDEYEPEILISALGRELYEEFKANLDSSGELIPGAVKKWDDLLNGKEYQKDGKTFFWNGLKTREGTLKKSLPAYYIYYRYLEFNNEQSTTLGQQKAGAENSVNVSPSFKMTRAWRKLYEWYGDPGVCRSIYPERTYIRGVYFEDFYHRDNNREVSLYEFLQDHKDEFPTWHFTRLENQNLFNI